MPLPKLTKSRRNVLAATHGHAILALPKSALRQLARIDIEIEKQKFKNPLWVAARRALVRFRNQRWRPQPPLPRPPVPSAYRNIKISHWLKDHRRRIADWAADIVCRAATGFVDNRLPHYGIAAFNGHIAPIAKLYGFELQLEIVGDNVELRGDTNKALSVLMYLSSESRTREIDWMLDVVTAFSMDPRPLDWKATWRGKLRHTKRGRYWRSAAK